ncbi:MAG: Crp/Fnr family transcriptional regulator [Candidatus Cyclobacteriaceae bacterium M2_1C_046]
MEENQIKLWHLEQFNVLKSLSMTDKMQLSKIACMMDFHKGDSISLPIEKQKQIFFLKKGHVRLNKSMESGDEILTDIIGPGEIFGWYIEPDAKNEVEVATALEECILCYLNIDVWNRFLNENAGFRLSVLKLIGIKLKRLTTKIQQLQFLTTGERLRKVIKDLADKHGRKIGLGYEIEIRLNLTHKDLAKLAGTSRQTVTTELIKMEDEGLISYDRRRILIRQYDKLSSH